MGGLRKVRESQHKMNVQLVFDSLCHQVSGVARLAIPDHKQTVSVPHNLFVHLFPGLVPVEMDFRPKDGDGRIMPGSPRNCPVLQFVTISRDHQLGHFKVGKCFGHLSPRMAGQSHFVSGRRIHLKLIQPFTNHSLGPRRILEPFVENLLGFGCGVLIATNAGSVIRKEVSVDPWRPRRRLGLSWDRPGHLFVLLEEADQMASSNTVVALVRLGEITYQIWVGTSGNQVYEAVEYDEYCEAAFINPGKWMRDKHGDDWLFDEFPLYGNLSSTVDCVVMPEKSGRIEGTRLKFYEVSPSDTIIATIYKDAYVLRDIKVIPQI